MAPSDLKRISEALRKVQSGHQARAAVGEALRALGNAYSLLEDVAGGSSYLTGGFTGEERAAELKSGANGLDDIRSQLEARFDGIPASHEPYSFPERHLCYLAYARLVDAEAAAGIASGVSWTDTLIEVIESTPGRVGQYVGELGAGVGKGAGDIVGGAAGGLLSGLGITGLIALAGVVLVLVWLSKRGVISIPFGLGKLAKVLG